MEVWTTYLSIYISSCVDQKLWREDSNFLFRAHSASASASASGSGSGSAQPTATGESNNNALQSSKLPQLTLPPPHLSLAQLRLWVQWRWPSKALPAELVVRQADAPFVGRWRISCPNPVGSYWSTSCPKSLTSRLHVCLFLHFSLLCCLVPDKNSLVKIKTFEKIPPREKDMIFFFNGFVFLSFFLQRKKKICFKNIILMFYEKTTTMFPRVIPWKQFLETRFCCTFCFCELQKCF